MVRLRSQLLLVAATTLLFPLALFSQNVSTATTPPKIAFSAPKAVNISSNSGSSRIVAIGDLNGDGKTDVITDGAVFLGNGKGGFTLLTSTEQTPVISFALPRPVDLNSDRKLDEVSFQEGSFDSDSCQVTRPADIQVWLGNGHGEFNAAAATYDLPPADSAIVVTGDFNRDGKPDLAVFTEANNQCFFSFEVTIFINKGNGNFKEGQIIDLPTGQFFDMVLGDFNGDGKPDLAVGGEYGKETSNNTIVVQGTIQTYEGNGDGSFRTGPKYTLAPIYPYQLLAADLNGDKRTDLVVFGAPTTPQTGKYEIVTLLSKSDGEFYWSSAVTLPAASGPQPQFADFNGDGKLDLLLPFYVQGDGGGSSIEVLTGDGGGKFSAPQGFTAYTGLNSAAAFPLTTGGRPDILFSATPTHKSFGLLVNESQ